jgi:hypothetical protein
MAMMSLAWAANAKLSAAGVASVLHWIRVAAVCFFGLACLRAGLSVALTFTLIVGAVAVLDAMSGYQLTVYPFLLIMPLAWSAACSFLYTTMRVASSPRVIACAAGGGLLAAWMTNLRTSSLPMVVALYAVLIGACACYRSRVLPGGLRQFVAMSIAAFVVALMGCSAAITYVFAPPGSAAQSNYTHHTIAHPLVVGLGVPPTPLSRSEGISWSDDVGWTIAQRVEPGVGYLGPGYERALTRYYLGLWRARPREMIAAYWTKLLRTGRGVFLFASDLVPPWRPLRKVYLVWADRTNGLEIILASIGATVAALWLVWRTASSVGMLAALLGAALILILIESALIYSEFALAYHSFMMFMVLVAPAIALQAAGDATAAWRRGSGAGRGRDQPA